MQFGKIYSFSCFRPSTSDEHGQIRHKCYSIVLYDPKNLEVVQLRYQGNYVLTNKYNAVNFIPKSFF